HPLTPATSPLSLHDALPISNNAPVSYGALGAPIIALAAVTGYPLLALSGSVGTVVAVLALAPPWVLLYLVSGKEGDQVQEHPRRSEEHTSELQSLAYLVCRL